MAQVRFENLSHSRRRIYEEHTRCMILHQSLRILVLVPILLPHVLDQNDKMGYYHQIWLPSFN